MAENNAKTNFTEVLLTAFISYVTARKFIPAKLQNYAKNLLWQVFTLWLIKSLNLFFELDMTRRYFTVFAIKSQPREVTAVWNIKRKLFIKKRKDSLETRAVLLILLLELEISGVAVQSIHQSSKKWRLLLGTAQ